MAVPPLGVVTSERRAREAERPVAPPLEQSSVQRDHHQAAVIPPLLAELQQARFSPWMSPAPVVAAESPAGGAPPLPLLPSEHAARAVLGRMTPVVDVPGLGPLVADPEQLRGRLARVVRAQGIEFAGQRVAALEEGAAELLARSRRLDDPRGVVRAAELLSVAGALKTGLQELGREQAAVKAAMLPRILGEADRVVEAALARAEAFRGRYLVGDDESRGALADLRRAAKALVAAREQVEGGSSVPEDARQSYRRIHAELAAEHPLLEMFDLSCSDWAHLEDLAQDREKVVNARGTPAWLPRPLERPLTEMLAGIEEHARSLRDQLERAPEKVFALPALVEATLHRLSIPSNSMLAGHTRDLVRRAEAKDELFRLFVSLTGAGLGVAAALPSGGTSLAAAGALVAAVDGYQLYTSLEQFRLTEAAHGIDLDRRRALAPEAPSRTWLALDAVAAATSVGGLAKAAGKSSLAMLRAERGLVGEMAEGLVLRLGEGRAATVIEALGGPKVASEVFADTPRELWTALAAAPEDRVTDALRRLGPELFVRWASEVPPRALGRLLGGLEPGTWGHLLSGEVHAKHLANAFERLGPKAFHAFAPTQRGRGLSEIGAKLGTAKATFDGERVIVDGHLAFVHWDLHKAATTGQLDGLRQEAIELVRVVAATLGEATASAMVFDRRPLQRLKELAKRQTTGPARPKDLESVAQQLQLEPARVRRILDEFAALAPLSSRAQGIASRAPELAPWLRALEQHGSLPPALKDRALHLLGEATTTTHASIDAEHLAGTLAHGLRPTDQPTRVLEDVLFEIEHAVAVVKERKVAEGSTVFTGVKPGKAVELAPGVRVELPKPKPGTKGNLEDLDVVYLTAEGKVRADEVKRSGNTLVANLTSTPQYLDKFVEWRAAGVDPGRELGIVIQHESRALDEMLEEVGTSARSLLAELGFELRVLSGR